MDEQVEFLDVAVIAGIIVTTRVVVHHNRYLTVGTHLLDELEHIVAPLRKDGILVGGIVNTLVAQGKSENDVAAEVTNKIVVTVQEILGGIAANRYIGGIEACIGQTFGISLNQVLAIEIAVALVIGCSLSVGHAGAKDRDAVLVDGSRDIIYIVHHIYRDGIGACILVDILCILSIGSHTQDIARGGIPESLDSKIIGIVQGKIHGLIHPLLRGSLLERYL